MKKAEGQLEIAGETYLSNSSAGSFRSCPYQFNLNYREGIRPINENISFYFGRKIHEALDYYFTQCRDSDMAITFFESTFLGGLEETPVLWSVNQTRKDGGDFKDAKTAVEYGKLMLEAYFDFWQDENLSWEVLESEKDFEIELDLGNGEKIKYRGIIDKLIKVFDKVYIVDHKCLAMAIDKELIEIENQISGYYLGAESLGYQIDGAIFDVLYKKKSPSFERYFVTRTKEQIKEFVEDNIETVRAIKAGFKFRNLGKECKVCKYRQFCFNGKELGQLYCKK